MTDLASDIEGEADRAAAAARYADAATLLVRAVESTPDRVELWAKLSAMHKAAGDSPAALIAIERALALSPLDFTALLARAMLLEHQASDLAGAAYCDALAQLPAGDAIPPYLKGAVEQARTKAAAHRDAVESRLFARLPNALLPAERHSLDRFIANSSRRLRHYHQEPTHFHYPGLVTREFHDVSAFDQLARLADLTDVIRAEFEALLAAEGGELVPYIRYPDRIALRQWQQLNNNRDWSAFHLIQNGTRIEANARHCPRTMTALATLDQPDVPGASPNALFSLLAPRTRIPPHTGVANTRLVAHLPLIVPAGCGFRCGATTVEWQVGVPFIFDDTIEHEAWNDSDEPRVVLIFDLWVPALSLHERQAIAQIIPAVGGGAAL